MDEDAIRDAVVNLVLACRSEYLAAGGNPITHWDRLHDRLRAAAALSSDVPGFVTRLGSGLQLGAPTEVRARAVKRLETVAAGRWLDLVEEEHGFLVALARLEAERRAETAAAARERRAAHDAEEEAALGRKP